jgi:hypothetical protein
MRTRLWAACLVALAAAARDGRAADAPATPMGPAAPLASAVVVRGAKDLADAVGACFTRVESKGRVTSVAVVLDVTDETRKASPDLARALAGAVSKAASWQVGALGAPLPEPVANADAVGTAVMATLARAVAGGPDTLGRLRKTIAGSKATLVVYVAHERFEDAVDLEGFIAEFRAAGRTLCVIGPEAAFERPVKSLFAVVPGIGAVRAFPEVGVSPFEPDDPETPWHSGDTAYPLIPWTFGGGWRFEDMSGSDPAEEELRRLAQKRYTPPGPEADDATFHRWAKEHVRPPDLATDPEGFRAWRRALGPPPGRERKHAASMAWIEKMRASTPPAPIDRSLIQDLMPTALGLPIPSNFGPYGLMRAAGVSGGAYVLWRWAGTRGGAKRPPYIAARCDELGPDLRARDAIFADVASRPRARALMRAWTLLSTSRPPLCSVTVPRWAERWVPLDYALEGICTWRLESPAERDHAVVKARAGMVQMGRVREMMDGEVAGLGVPDDPVDRRLQADVELLLHALDSMRFSVGEFILASRALPADAWSAASDGRVLEPTSFALGDGEVPRASQGPPIALQDPAAGAALVAARKAFLDRYRGTPFGAIAEQQWIYTYGPPNRDR